MKYEKPTSVSGSWLKGSEVESGTKAKIVNECVPQETVYEGKPRTQNIAKVRLQGDQGEAKNVNINKPSISALIDAFGDDSKDWIGKVLTIHTEKVLIAGKRQTAMYFVPEGYSVKEDDNGYLVIGKNDVQTTPTTSDGKPVPFPDDEEINPADIPF